MVAEITSGAKGWRTDWVEIFEIRFAGTQEKKEFREKKFDFGLDFFSFGAKNAHV
jgi:hypothetical protein